MGLLDNVYLFCKDDGFMKSSPVCKVKTQVSKEALEGNAKGTTLVSFKCQFSVT